MSCENNLKQIALAAMSYENSYGVLPPGSMGDIFGGSWIGTPAYILPYIEQNNIYTQIPTGLLMPIPAPTTGALVPWWTNGAWNASLNKVKTFNCPADNPDSQNPSSFVDALFFCYSSSLYYEPLSPPTSYPMGRTNYFANAGALGNVGSSQEGGDTFYGQYCGPFFADSKTTIVSITDGTSNTFSFGEALGGTNVGQRDSCVAWMGAGALPTAWGLIQPCQFYSYGSQHDGVVNFAMCDGSVKGVKKGVGASGGSTNWFSGDWYVLQQAAGMADGVVYPPAVLYGN
jgi:prepilin-type processing-associated H-X9-DG protein